MKYVTLNNGIEMPILGYGVYQINNDETEKCVLDAISVGYRLIDTAQVYSNEDGVGNAIKKSGVKREELFITTKIWISNTGYEKAKVSIDESLKKLKTDYIDLILIHEPFGDYYGVYRAMVEAYKCEKVRAIGVSNFYPDRLIDICKFQEVIPAINQVETHIYYQQIKEREIMNKYGVQHEGWAPFAEGANKMFSNKILLKIANKYRKSVPQIILRFLIENDIVVIPKSIQKSRMIENFDIFNFELSNKDKKIIRDLDKGKSLFFSHYDPEVVERFLSE